MESADERISVQAYRLCEGLKMKEVTHIRYRKALLFAINQDSHGACMLASALLAIAHP